MPGLDVNMFVDLNESLSIHLKCSICTDIFNKPVDTICKHTFCEDCIKLWLQSVVRKECPMCRQEMTDSDFSTNRLVKEIINDLKVKCEAEDCETVVPFGSLGQHLNECQFRKCTECGYLLVEGHNCLQSTQLDLAQMKDTILKLEANYKALESRMKNSVDQKNIEISALKSKVYELEHVIDQSKCSLGQILDKSSCYVDQNVDTRRNCFEIVYVDTDVHKLIRINKSFIKVQVNKMIVANSGTYDYSYPVFYCLKKGSNFLELKNALINSDRERPELRTGSGGLINDYDTPYLLHMTNHNSTYRITYHYPSEQNNSGLNKRLRLQLNSTQ